MSSHQNHSSTPSVSPDPSVDPLPADQAGKAAPNVSAGLKPTNLYDSEIHGNRIENVYGHDLMSGIDIYQAPNTDSRRVTISGNWIRNCRGGIRPGYVDGSASRISEVLIDGNIIVGEASMARSAVQLVYCRAVVVSNNTISLANRWITDRSENQGIDIDTSEYIDVVGNTVNGSRSENPGPGYPEHYGITVNDESTHVNVCDNVIFNLNTPVSGFDINSTGIAISDSASFVKVSGNMIKDATYGIQIFDFRPPAITQVVLEANIIELGKSPNHSGGIVIKGSIVKPEDIRIANNFIRGPVDPTTGLWDGIPIGVWVIGGVNRCLVASNQFSKMKWMFSFENSEDLDLFRNISYDDLASPFVQLASCNRVHQTENRYSADYQLAIIHPDTAVPGNGLLLNSTSNTITHNGEDDIVSNLTNEDAVTVNLGYRNLYLGRRVTVKDAKGDAGTNNITVYPPSGHTIDGATSHIINGLG